jgi:hypothetical protein
MRVEKTVMARFVEIIENDEPLVNPGLNRYQVYRDMVYFRFHETISSIYPIVSMRLAEQLPGLIREFQREGAKSPLMAEMANEFGAFLRRHPLNKELAYLDDLLWFEWSEMELLMDSFDDRSVVFGWKTELGLSDSARMRKIRFALYRGDFETYGKYPIVLYYDHKEEQVCFNEITALGYLLLELLLTHTPQESLAEIAKKFKVDQKDLKEPLETLMRQWCDKKILQKR